MIGRYPQIAFLFLFFLFLPERVALAQVDEARQAIERGDFANAVEILSNAVGTRPEPDTYLYLGIAYANLKEYDKAEETFLQGISRFPADTRFHNEMAGIHLARNDVETAKESLRRALEIEPENSYASDLLATIDMSEGNVQGALKSWNNSGRPIIDDILHNYYLNFGSWVVGKATAFRPSGVLRYGDWKTTEARLLESMNFTNVALEVEPTIVPERYNAVIRTTAKTNGLNDIIFGLVKGAPIEWSFLDIWNIRNSGINFNSGFRWEAARRRLEGHLKVPLPLPGLLFMDAGEVWRSEYWNLTPTIRPEFDANAQFQYKSTGALLHFRHIADYRLELGVGYEYINRAASGNLPQLFTDSLNTGRIVADANVRLVADGTYRNRLRLEGFLARTALLGNFDYTGGTAELNNRIALTSDGRTNFDFTVKGGTARGALPVEDYFVLGLDFKPRNLLRGHGAVDNGHYGNSPMGTDFVLMNFDIERRLVTVPMFNTFNLPYLTINTEIFFDGAKTFDRARIFKQGELWLDVGAVLGFETPSHSFKVAFGRSLRDGTGVVMAFVERRIW